MKKHNTQIFRNKILRALPFLALALVIGLYQNCSQEKLQKLEALSIVNTDTATVNINFCTTPPDQVRSRLKYIFIYDKSQSNQTFFKLSAPGRGTLLGPFAGTDPDGARRYPAVRNFLDSIVDTTDTSFALVNFSTSAGIATGSAAAGYFVNKASFYTQIVNTEYNFNGTTGLGAPVDSGSTNYLNALQRAQDIIRSDIRRAKDEAVITREIVASFYIIFFISDGYPVIQLTANNDGTFSEDIQSPAQILGSVSTFEDILKNDKRWVDGIQLNTAYYTTPDSEDVRALNLLTNMADEGGGSFENFSAGAALDLSRFSPPLRRIRYALRDVLVSNLNTVWVGRDLVYDSDGDGLSDLLEMQLGSNMSNVDSDNNGINDGFEYFATRAAPTTGASYNCIDPSQDIDHDFINDCSEKTLIKTDYDMFDSNEDWVPDDLAFRREVAAIAGTSEVAIDPDGDGVNNYLEIKEFTPLRVPNSQLLDLRKYKYNQRLVSRTNDQDCYEVNVTDISTINTNNQIRVYVMETSAIVQDKKIMRTALKRVPGKGGTITFTDSDLVE